MIDSPTKEQQCPECDGLNVHYSYCSLRMKEIPTSNPQFFIAWSDDGQYVAALLGTSETREQMQERIDRDNEQERRTVNRLRPVEITVHLASQDETTASRPFYQLLDDYFNALVRGGRQTQIDEARLAIIREYERVSGLSAVHGTPLHQALGSPLEPTRCIDCGVSLVPEARHFSGCKSHPGERAVKAK